MITQTIDIQKFTKLPVRIVQTGEKLLPDLLLQTPHKGVVTIALKKEHYPFIFGSVTQTEKHFSEVHKQIKQIEEEAIDYLFGKWKETLTPIIS